MADSEDLYRVLVLSRTTESEQLERVFKALDSLKRIRILEYLTERVASVNDVATALDMPLSTTAVHIETLEAAGLIRTVLEPASRGLRKMCARMYDRIVLDLPKDNWRRTKAVDTTMPIGMFTDCQAFPTCGIAGQNGIIGQHDDPVSFYEPGRIDAQLIWFHHGYLEYRFPNRVPAGMRPEALLLSMEICSEAPFSNPDWPSDITVWINGHEIGTWTSPADFGGEAGLLTPEWWLPQNTQYGLLKTWHVTELESQIDGEHCSTKTIYDLDLMRSHYITMRVGVKPDAANVGGLNLFGSRFGNYPQDIMMRVSYRPENDAL